MGFEEAQSSSPVPDERTRTIAVAWKILAGISLTVVVEWALLANPGGRLIGLVVLAVLLGFAGLFALAPFTFAVGALAHRWGTVPAVLLAGACLSVGVLAMIGSIERAKPGYVWKYGEPTRVAVPADWSCALSGYKCAASWTSGGKTVRGGLTMSSAEFRTLRSPMAVGVDNAYHFDARALGNRATSAGLHVRPASSVALGKVPAWSGWTAGAVGVAAAVFAMVLPRRTSTTTSEERISPPGSP
jgi:hypothetical protein